ncbi:MAG: cell division protein FtsA [Candidatus Ryanbacteria bacterium]|nr:cell division protein FtsA [Candidatus Ryanbacteria bacterium]
MAQKNYFIGCDIGSATIRIVALERRDELGLAVAGAVECATEGMRRGAVVSPETVAKSIQRARADLKKLFSLDVDHANVSIGESRLAPFVSRGAVSVSRADGEITHEDARRALEAAEAALPRLGNREIIHSFPLAYTVDKDAFIREPVGMVGAKLEVEALFVGGFTPHIKNLLKACDIAGLDIENAFAAPYAASFHVLSRKQKEVGTLLLDIGAQTSALAVFEEGLLLSLEILPVGSNHITQDIAVGFQIDLASAERMKRNLGAFMEQGKKEIRLGDLPKNLENSFSPKKLRDIVRARLDDIFELVDKHLRRVNRNELLPGGVVLAGGGARLFDIQDAVREELHLPVEIAYGVSGLSGRKELIAGPEWMVAVGLARVAAENAPQAGRMGEFFSSNFSRRVGKFLKTLVP